MKFAPRTSAPLKLSSVKVADENDVFVRLAPARIDPVKLTPSHSAFVKLARLRFAPPRFVFFTNVATTFHFSYERFLVNQLREEFGFMGTPIPCW